LAPPGGAGGVWHLQAVPRRITLAGVMRAARTWCCLLAQGRRPRLVPPGGGTWRGYVRALDHLVGFHLDRYRLLARPGGSAKGPQFHRLLHLQPVLLPCRPDLRLYRPRRATPGARIAASRDRAANRARRFRGPALPGARRHGCSRTARDRAVRENPDWLRRDGARPPAEGLRATGAPRLAQSLPSATTRPASGRST